MTNETKAFNRNTYLDTLEPTESPFVVILVPFYHHSKGVLSRIMPKNKTELKTIKSNEEIKTIDGKTTLI